jgi:hypothetical protein
MEIRIDDKKLYSLIRKAVDDAMKANQRKQKLDSLPCCDDDEIKEIKAIFCSPKKYKNKSCKIRKI